MMAAIYARVSTDDQSTELQEKMCHDYCMAKGIEVGIVYREVISGAKTSRPQFNQLLDDMRHSKFDCIVVTKLDRMGRSLQHLLSLFDEFSNRGVAFIATTQNIDTTSASGRLQMQILGAFAEFERNLISERTREGLKVATGVGKRGKDKVPRKRRGAPKKKEKYEGMVNPVKIPVFKEG